jgi:hypothetical protein
VLVDPAALVWLRDQTEGAQLVRRRASTVH